MARGTIIKARNNTGTTIYAGSVVYISGHDETIGQPTIALADNRYESRMPAVGVVSYDAEHGEYDIKVRTSGACAGFDTFGRGINTNVYVGRNGGIVYGEDPYDSDVTVISQRLGTVLTQEDYPIGQLQLFPFDVKKRIPHDKLIDVELDQHHEMNHADRHRWGGPDALDYFHMRAWIGAPIGSGSTNHIAYWKNDDTLYYDSNLQWDPDNNILKFGSTSSYPAIKVNGATLEVRLADDSDYSILSCDYPTADDHAATKKYVDDTIIAIGAITGSGVANKVVLWSGTNSVTYDTDLHYDSATNSLGIGTASPEHLLSVFKDNNAASTQIGIDNLDQRLVLSAYYESGVTQYAAIQSTNNAESGGLALALNPIGGNVGIGTLSPYTNLHVWDSTSAIIKAQGNATPWVAGLSLQSGSGLSGESAGMYSYGTTGEVRIGGLNTNYYITLYTNNSEKVRIKTTGEVGIGVTDPDEKLHLNGNIKMLNGSWATANEFLMGSAIVVSSISRRASSRVIDYVSGVDSTSTTGHAFFIGSTQAMFIDQDAQVGIGTSTTPAQALHLNGVNGGRIRLEETGAGGISWDIVSANNVTHGASDGDLLFYNATAAATRAVLTAAGNLAITSGIWTIANDTLLHLNGGNGINTGANIELYGAIHASFPNTAWYDALTHTFRNQAGSAIYAQITSDGMTVTAPTAASVLAVYAQASGQSSLVTIGEGGSGNRYAYLDLVGDGTYVDYGLRIIRGNLGANSNSEFQHRGTGGLVFTAQDAGYLNFLTSNTERMIIDAYGQVGIGTPSPEARLHVYGADDSSYGQLKVESTGNDARISLYNSNGATTTGRGDILMSKTTGYEGLRFMINNSDAMIIDENKKVGIGTPAPAKPLHILSTDSGYGQLRIMYNSASAGEASVGFYEATGTVDTSAWIVGVGGWSNTSDFVIGQNGVKFLIENSTGKIGMGTTTIPHGGIGSAMLALDGTNVSTAGPHIQITTTADNYPVFQQLNYGHDNISFGFDMYWDGAWRSSDAGSNFQIYKISDKLSIKYDSGIAQGSGVSMNDGITLNTSGTVGMPAMQQYISTRITADSTGSSSLYNPFDTDNGATTTTDVSNGIIYAASTGRFTIAYAGVYEITVVFNMSHGVGGSSQTSHYIYRNGSPVYSAEANMYDNTDIESFTLNMLLSCSASDYIEPYVDGVSNIICHPGSSVVIKRIA